MHSLWQLIVSVKLALSVKNTLEKLWSTHILRLLTIICLHFVNLNSFRCQYQNWTIYKSIILQYRIVVMPYSFGPKLPQNNSQQRRSTNNHSVMIVFEFQFYFSHLEKVFHFSTIILWLSTISTSLLHFCDSQNVLLCWFVCT